MHHQEGLTPLSGGLRDGAEDGGGLGHRDLQLRGQAASAFAAAVVASLLALGVLLAGKAGIADAADSVRPLLPSRYRADILRPAKGRVLVVNFWATWCEPCREEMPSLADAAHSVPKKELSVVLVSADTKATSRGIPAFLDAQKVPFPCWLVSSPDPQAFIDAVDPKWDGTLPYTLVYDRKGKLVERLDGFQTDASFKAAIQRAMAR